MPKRPVRRIAEVAALAGLAASLVAPGPTRAASFRGRVASASGEPVVGAMVTVQSGDPAHAVTVFSDAEGRYATPELVSPPPYVVRVRRIGWRDLRATDRPAPARPFDVVLER